jgi:uncharacterized protein YjbI with pentapeptide repeats
VQVVKPQALSLLTRSIEYRKRFGLCITASLHVPFDQGPRGTLWGEQSMWKFLSKEMAAPLIDEGISKLTSEFLVHGHAYPPPGSPNACAVRVRLAEREKTVLVYGDRYWDGSTPSAPQVFENMPLSWDHAYGGVDFPANPGGKGRASVDGLRWLPNLELPQNRLLRPDQLVTPAGFGLLDVMHPQRVQYRGSYDANYLKEHSPGFAPDMDWRYFNLAPADQWLDQPLVGDESFSLDHLHPTQAHIEGRLPGLRVRAFATYRLADGSSKLREVPMRLTTVWFFPHARRCVLLCHGLAEVSTDDASDVTGLLGAVERLGSIKSDEHYATVLEQRADPKMGAVHSLRDSDLLPEGLSTGDPDTEEVKKVFAMDGLQADAQYRRAEIEVELARERVRATGQDPDAMGIRMAPRVKPPTGDELAGYLERQMKLAEQQQWQALDDMAKALEKALVFAAANKVDLAQMQHRGPPAFRAETQLQELLQSGSSVTGHPQDLYAQLIRKDSVERLGYLQAAHEQPPAMPMAQVEAQVLRREIEQAISKGLRFFAGLDLTGADLSELDLRGANFAGAWLESVNLCGSNVSGADFSKAVLAHANLSQSIGVGANFCGANLGRTLLQGAVFDDADFSGATLTACSFAQTQFRRATVSGALLFDTTWGAADWTGVKAAGQTFYKLDLRGMVLAESDLSDCTLIECNLNGVDLRAANLARTTFVTCNLDGALLQSANAQGAVLVKDCSLIQADLSQANFGGCNFGGADMTGIRLVRAVLDGANLSEAKAGQSDWRLASAKAALMRRAGLRGALLAGVNFQGAILQHADLRGADLRNSNLFAADLSRARLDGDVRLEGALLKRARTWPRLTPAQQASNP